jgi:DNA helicase-2/ATP-dependent DNA helicase PcrA
MKKISLRPRGAGELHLVRPDRFTVDYKNKLNAAQYQAATTVNGPVLVIAGSGTGKTMTIAYRVAYLIELGVRPENILLLTFTRKAAEEMLRRASLLLDTRCDSVAGGTFHSFANLTLRKYASLLGYDPSFTILDQGDAEDVINLIRMRMKYDAGKKRFPRKDTLYDLYSRSINTVTPLETLLNRDYPHYTELVEDIQKLFQGYVSYKKQNHLMDYDDLLANLVTLMERNEAIRASLSEKNRHVMVDEYQDTNSIQARIIKLLAYKHDNIMVVGDDAQAIYSFRGSTVKNILEFPSQFKNCAIITLEENYRSTQPILNLANTILLNSRKVSEA